MIESRDPHPLVRTWSEGDTFHLDVRAFLEQGGEPYTLIMDCVSQIGPQDKLVVHALFEPGPLIAHLTGMGLVTHCERVEPEHWALHVAPD